MRTFFEDRASFPSPCSYAIRAFHSLECSWAHTPWKPLRFLSKPNMLELSHSFGQMQALLALTLAAWISIVGSRPVGSEHDSQPRQWAADPSSASLGFHWQNDHHSLQAWSPDLPDLPLWSSPSPVHGPFTLQASTSPHKHDHPNEKVPIIDLDPPSPPSSPSMLSHLLHSPQPGLAQQSFGSAGSLSSATRLTSSVSNGARPVYEPAMALLPLSSSSRQSTLSVESPIPAFFLNGQKFRQWEQSMRIALGNPLLEFHALDGLDIRSRTIFVAQHRGLAQDRHTTLGSLQRLSPNSAEARSLWAGHFLSKVRGLRGQKTKVADFSPSEDRTFVYLDSRHNMDYLNREYFRNHLELFPLKAERLQWSFLNYIIAHRHSTKILPARTEHGLPLIVARHSPGTPVMSSIQRVMGVPLVYDRQVVSLWSPVLVSKTRTTIVLYGIGQLDTRHGPETVERLEELAAEGQNRPLTAAYYLAQDWPEGWRAAGAARRLLA